MAINELIRAPQMGANDGIPGRREFNHCIWWLGPNSSRLAKPQFRPAISYFIALNFFRFGVSFLATKNKKHTTHTIELNSPMRFKKNNYHYFYQNIAHHSLM